MTERSVADELEQVLGRASTKWWAVYGKLKTGKLPPDQVLAALQAIHDGRFGQPVGDGSVVAPVVRQRPRLIHGRYTPPELQLANVRKWNAKRGWNIPEDWFTNLGPAPAWPNGKLQCVTLEVALPDQPETKDGQGNTIPAIPGMIRTVREFWDIISHQHPNHWKLPEISLDAEHLELLEGATYEPGLRWRVHDLGANWDTQNGIRPIDVRNPQTSPNVDGFATLAHHPRYVRSMNGTAIPFLWIAGFVVTVPGRDPRRHVLIVDWVRDDRQVGLGARWVGSRDPDYAVPGRLGV